MPRTAETRVAFVQFYQIMETELDCEGDATSMLCTISPYASKEYAETLGELVCPSSSLFCSVCTC